MAGAKRLADADLAAWLARDAKRFGFFQAVDLLERLSPHAASVGHTGPAEAEAIRFRHDPDLSFHVSDVKSITLPAPGSRPAYTIVETSFLGLFGAVSPLPVSMSEDVLAAEAADEPSLRSFYDLFHHRILSLFYRTWQKHRIAIGHRTDARDPFTRRALALVGVDIAGALPERGLPPMALLGLSPLMARRVRSPHALKVAAARLLGIDVDVESFVLRRTTLLAEQRVTLGVRNTSLGTDMAIGRTVADRGGRFRVLMGPLDKATFDAVSPGGRLYPTLDALLRHFSGNTLEAEVEIRLSADQVPRFQLGTPRGAELGRATRLGDTAGRPLRARFVLGAGPEDAKARLVREHA